MTTRLILYWARFCSAIIAALAIFGSLSFAVYAQENNSELPSIVERTIYTFPFDNYDDWLAFMDRAPEPAWRADNMRSLIPEDVFERYRTGDTVKKERIVYLNDNLRINGFLVSPQNCAPKCPVIIYAQGGAAQWSRITFFDILEMHRLAEKGFIILASARRGEGGSEGEPNLGAGDLSDTLALIKLADAMPEADTSNISYLGFSRGGALGYRVLAATDRIASAVMIGAPSDLVHSPRRAEFHEFVYPGIVDGYEENEDAALQALSAVYWPEKLSKNTRLLMLHGATDKRVKPSNSMKLAERLLLLNRPISLVLYDNGSHSLIEHYVDVRHEIDQWFSQ